MLVPLDASVAVVGPLISAADGKTPIAAGTPVYGDQIFITGGLDPGPTAWGGHTQVALVLGAGLLALPFEVIPSFVSTLPGTLYRIDIQIAGVILPFNTQVFVLNASEGESVMPTVQEFLSSAEQTQLSAAAAAAASAASSAAEAATNTTNLPAMIQSGANSPQFTASAMANVNGGSSININSTDTIICSNS